RRVCARMLNVTCRCEEDCERPDVGGRPVLRRSHVCDDAPPSVIREMIGADNSRVMNLRVVVSIIGEAPKTGD
ncbi:hypothetical protein QBC45DRAFT_325042, partial [Copromyces sp. CBS 386.78]